MKTIFLLLLSVSLGFGDSFREWTQLGSGKTITAKIIDKKDDNSAVLLTMKNGKSPWVKTVDLVQEDRDFIVEWKKMPIGFHFLTVTMSGKRQGGNKMITVVARSHDKPVVCKVYSGATGGHKDKFTVPTGSTSNLDFSVGRDYRVTLEDEEGEIIDEETSKKKTRK